MCELLGLSAARPVDLSFSLAQLARRGGLEAANLEGWGLAAYQDYDVAIAREPRPASDSRLLRCMEQNLPATCLALSHLRQATVGERCLRNTQPFVRALGGRQHVFAHNGHLPDIGQLGGCASRWRPIGDTDSEIAFGLLMDALEPLWSDTDAPPIARRIDVIVEFASRIRPLGPANFLYSDGEILVAHGHRRIKPDGEIRPPGLVMRVCDDLHTGGFAAEGLAAQGDAGRALVFASVPLSDANWQPLTAGELVIVRHAEILARRGR